MHFVIPEPSKENYNFLWPLAAIPCFIIHCCPKDTNQSHIFISPGRPLWLVLFLLISWTLSFGWHYQVMQSSCSPLTQLWWHQLSIAFTASISNAAQRVSLSPSQSPHKGRRIKKIEEALKSHLSWEGYVGASHMEGCHDPPCQWRPLNPGTGCVQGIQGQGMTEAGRIHETPQKHWTVLKPIRQGMETTQPQWGERCDGYSECTQNFSKGHQSCNEGNDCCGGMGQSGREIQNLNDWW